MAEPIAIAAVPAKDEADRIGACLRALAAQTETLASIVLVINNTTDDTAAIVRGLMPSLGTPVTLIEHSFPPELASAGEARRMAMERAAALLEGTGMLLTTDADGMVPPDWVAANRSYLRTGVEAVAGRAVLDEREAVLIPAALHADDALEQGYAAALDRLAAQIDPLPWDPWPRHTERSGASIAVTLDAYRRAGGMPAARVAEDRQFFEALERVDARIRHAPEIAVTVSGRTVGRAAGGMADTIRRRLRAPDPYLDSALEPAAAFVLRLRSRALFRRAWGGESGLIESLAAALALPCPTVAAACAAPFMGEGWQQLTSESPALVRRLVRAEDVGRERAAAEEFLIDTLGERVPLGQD